MSQSDFWAVAATFLVFVNLADASSVSSSLPQNSRDRFLNTVYFRRGLTCTLGLTNDLIDGGQLRAKPRLRKAKPNHVLETVFSPQLATVYQVVG